MLCICADLHHLCVTVLFFICAVTGSLGARITELKQKVIAENPRCYGLAVPREFILFFF